ncbi:hypothetical protein PVAP13_9NG747977 [Panicum virgatum]|uniref:Reverse transcriptase zinc-binding domain-containing protein n=1 Tax=Panicum virgatum TaxID=38727 RepID=A0A8T0N8T2_PANVG|nr:hypothetical protein PVAP13_9NG747977 [Panicum virgatum]
MVLESVTCDLCILQRTETDVHLILRCNFANACWNDWIFNNRDPLIQECKPKFCREFKLILLKAKQHNVTAIEPWLAMQL